MVCWIKWHTKFVQWKRQSPELFLEVVPNHIMSANEFDIIRRFFTTQSLPPNVVLGIGDDCALLTVPEGKQLAVTVDTLVEGVHFPCDTSPEDIAWKSVAVNLSDLAAMGATPAWLTLALTIPEVDESWLEKFAKSFHDISKQYNVALVGGDTTQGVLSITVQAHGLVELDHVMRRDMAKPGDAIYVTGTLGDASLALGLLQSNLLRHEENQHVQYLQARLNRPQPQLAFATKAAQYVRCAIDISDGLLADLGHIMRASRCGADIYLKNIPLSDSLREVYRNNNEDIDMQRVLSGGDDYELCLTIDADFEQELVNIASEQGLRLSRIGAITDCDELRCFDSNNKIINFDATGYLHFSD